MPLNQWTFSEDMIVIGPVLDVTSSQYVSVSVPSANVPNDNGEQFRAVYFNIKARKLHMMNTSKSF